MEHVCMVEPDGFVRPRMPGDRLANLAGSKPILIHPLKRHAGLPAIGFDSPPVVGLKSLLPWEINALAIVADVHDLLFHKGLLDRLRNPLIKPTIVGNGSLPPLLGSLLTEE